MPSDRRWWANSVTSEKSPNNAGAEHIIAKLEVSGRTQAVVKGLELGILGLSTEGR